MSKQLSAEWEEKIYQEAQKRPKDRSHGYGFGWSDGYEAGAEKYALELVEAHERIKILEIALQVVAKWSFPETGKFWDDDKTQPMSFGACYGSNGERDYMRSIANEALSTNNKQKEDE